MDIHLAKEQLSAWYCAINPFITVPTLTDNNQIWTDSRDILNLAAKNAADTWYDTDPYCCLT
ncbi:glutathione S-transferase N-terminal domain-containing protein [Candidatus Berkiella aquae]|uniref:Glutathione S-transferase N-terminal domain-containing protein n=1 Tax=Candidatus Berkiella aquae TaxID=295108 RepID=A0A0Q9YJF0_9GAMM|nr:glutathione S-transferase N-terminal domain-containing protein [Candidatus Berkiella aquae]MCS5710665.1 glutathione S-transferase N-terminal domain-containing protein [Candidatus Berkiella aquae]